MATSFRWQRGYPLRNPHGTAYLAMTGAPHIVLYLTDRAPREGYCWSMSAKYYTQFLLTDAQYRGGNEFSGVVELSRPIDNDADTGVIEAVLAKNFDLQQNAVKLVSWSRLH